MQYINGISDLAIWVSIKPCSKIFHRDHDPDRKMNPDQSDFDFKIFIKP